MIFEFFLTWIGLGLLILWVMTIDNFRWMSSSPEWTIVGKLKFKDYLRYVWNDRVIPVWTDWRDISPAILTSFSLALILFGHYILGIVSLLVTTILTIVLVKLFEGPRSWK